MELVLKEIEKDILAAAAQRNGKIVADVIRPLRVKYSEEKMRHYVTSLADAGFLKLDRVKVAQRVFVKITKRGRRMIANGPL
jgi:DNA-binding MarR family transcriptional regulator